MTLHRGPSCAGNRGRRAKGGLAREEYVFDSWTSATRARSNLAIAASSLSEMRERSDISTAVSFFHSSIESSAPREKRARARARVGRCRLCTSGEAMPSSSESVSASLLMTHERSLCQIS